MQLQQMQYTPDEKNMNFNNPFGLLLDINIKQAYLTLLPPLPNIHGVNV